jgi:hypothetical protein
VGVDKFYQTYKLERGGSGANSYLGGSAYSLVGTYRGFLQIASSTLQSIKESEGELSTYILFTGASVPIRNNDIIVYNSIRYLVIEPSASEGISGLGNHKEVKVQRFKR